MNARTGFPLTGNPRAVDALVLRSLQRAATTAVLRVAVENFDPETHIHQTWGDEGRHAATLYKAATEPASTNVVGWAAELSSPTRAYLASLPPLSAGAALLARGLQLSFDGTSDISLPFITPVASTFIGERQPIPVREYQTSEGVHLYPHKLASLSTVTNEMLRASNAEQVVSTVMRESGALGLDAVLFSAAGATAIAPAGLLNGIAPSPPSALTPIGDAMRLDLASLIGTVARAGGDDVVLVGAPEQMASVRVAIPTVSVLSTQALVPGTVIAVAAPALVSAFTSMPEIETVRETAVHHDDTPLDLVSGSPGIVASPISSIFQTDKVALRMILRASWAMRAPAIAWMQGVSW